MKVISPLALVLIAALVPALCLTSCTPSGGSVGDTSSDGSYSPPPALSPVDATERLRSEYREWIR